MSNNDMRSSYDDLPPSTDDVGSLAEHELMLRLDLAMEVLEGMDQLGVDNRTDLVALLDRLESRIDDVD